jgi:hypothetical protein
LCLGGKLLTYDEGALTWDGLLAAAQAKLGSAQPFTRVFVENGAEASAMVRRF